jgi:hypothetical protein
MLASEPDAHRSALIHAIMCMITVHINACFLDPFLTYMEAPAPFTTVDRQAMAFAEITGCLVPEVQDDTMFVRATPLFVEDLAASGIGLREN